MEDARLEWRNSLSDPFREEALSDLDRIPEFVINRLPPVIGPPAFDPEEIGRIAESLSFSSEIRFTHPLLERAVRVGLAHIDATFQGDHPKYGTGVYAREEHDGFPPTIIAAVDALSLWDRTERAEELFSYWLHHFVREDGSIDYYGPSLSEYGQLLTTARKLYERSGDADWLSKHRLPLARIAGFLHALHDEGGGELVKGSPEADERDFPAAYFHNNAWIVRGWTDWAFLLANVFRDEEAASRTGRQAETLRKRLLETIDETWPSDPNDGWLRPMAEPEEPTGYWTRPVRRVTENRLGSFANYRYWPELLSSGVLPTSLMERIVEARLSGGGQFMGVTRFEGHLDDWPLMDHLEGLWRLGRTGDYLLCLWGHIRYHQAESHLTAYEQVSLPPGEKVADYCLPCQLVAVRAARRLVSS